MSQRTAQGRYREACRRAARMAAYLRLQQLHPEEYGELLTEERSLDPGPGRPYDRARKQAWIRLSKLYFLQHQRLLKEERLARGLAPPPKPASKMTPRHTQEALEAAIDKGRSGARLYPTQELLEALEVAVKIVAQAASGRTVSNQQDSQQTA